MVDYNCFTFITLALLCQVMASTYMAGVVEFAPFVLQPTITPSQLIMKNAQRYVEIIATSAQHDVDILVFPECGLTSINIPTVREEIPPYLTKIPDIGVNPCDHPQAPQVLRLLSCAARSHRLYIVFNLEELVDCTPNQPNCPSDNSLFYNTNVALDRDGLIIAKYRKFNLFDEPEFNSTQTPDHSWFDTDFGVRFGMFICFDILFKQPTDILLSPQNISNFVYSTAWFSELPLLTAASVQAGWAYMNDVNLLAAGYSNTPNKNCGSGIYAGRDGTLTVTLPDHSSTKLLIAEISPDKRGSSQIFSEQITFTEDTSTTLDFYHDDLSNFSNTLVTGKESHLHYAKDSFECNVTVELLASGGSPVYRMVAFSGLRSYASIRTVYIEVCGVVACDDLTLSSCSNKPTFQSSSNFKSISILASSSKFLLTSYPITLDKALLPFPSKAFQFRSKKINERTHRYNMVTQQDQSDFIAFALFRNG